ncbi:WXG100 family type VII secretion target [Mycobacteroides abscessus subsp. abscessus]|uniref:WXG100 family type VII secretion target n=1 Tax=Mycobacteroides abscessus TaxID=36809 RepID=UPI0009D5CA7D|nr:WXG100 family type VII secretion target [Mycobacteroides abscessus]SLI30098.1 WXG100 family type VII secretion target [Mycobacteroides abscessus subsp. abscessus]
MSGLVHVNTPEVDAAKLQIVDAQRQTEDNWRQSLQIVQASQDNFGGQGSQAFQDAIAQVNHQYEQDTELLGQAAHALGMSNDGFTETDTQMAGQYP